MQHRYQALDEGFIGIIVSCFNSMAPSLSCMRTQVIAFQSVRDISPDVDKAELTALDSPTKRAIIESVAGKLLFLLHGIIARGHTPSDIPWGRGQSKALLLISCPTYPGHFRVSWQMYHHLLTQAVQKLSRLSLHVNKPDVTIHC
jgi:hypothetical protein